MFVLKCVSFLLLMLCFALPCLVLLWDVLFCVVLLFGDALSSFAWVCKCLFFNVLLL